VHDVHAPWVDATAGNRPVVGMLASASVHGCGVAEAILADSMHDRVVHNKFTRHTNSHAFLLLPTVPIMASPCWAVCRIVSRTLPAAARAVADHLPWVPAAVATREHATVFSLQASVGVSCRPMPHERPSSPAFEQVELAPELKMAPYPATTASAA
jgi:hypothetical protein